MIAKRRKLKINYIHNSRREMLSVMQSALHNKDTLKVYAM